MGQTWIKFKTDKFFLTKYFVTHMFALSLLIALVIYRQNGIKFEFALNWSILYLLPLSIIFGIQIPVLMHNCMHSNLKTTLSNRIAGELSGFFALMSLDILRINHMLHHAHADSENDPHDPAHKSFVEYFFMSQLTGAQIIERRFLKYHGASLKNRMLFKFNISLHYFSHLVRLLVWYLVLGPELFYNLYLPSFLIYSLAFAHVNYITHRTDELGNALIINKDDNLYYNFINFIGSGVYYHKNHHEHPKLMNPMIVNKKEKVYESLV